jgi:hypothetical protein
MGFNRQLDYLVAILITPMVFVGCILYGPLPIMISLLVSACVFFAVLLFGRRVAEIVANIL